MTRAYHIPVLLQPCITNLNIKPDGVYVDLTFGGGGHSKEILKHLSKDGKLYTDHKNVNLPERKNSPKKSYVQKFKQFCL